VGCRQGDVQFLFAGLAFIKKCTARTMIEHFASHRDPFFSVMPFADGILAFAQRLGFTIHFAALRLDAFLDAGFKCLPRGRPYSRIRRRRRSAWRSALRSNRHISEIAFRATGVSAVEGW
jgi:hypothetical protein